MPYLVVDNFSAGLDARRHVLNSKDGTLSLLKNAHITRGGEIEKRKAFKTFATLPANTFGLETTSDKVFVFGSVASVVVPTGMTYQRLQHPNGTTAMTKVVWSSVYGGLPFVIAEFADNARYCYWNGAIIGDWFIGAAGGAVTSLTSLVSSVRSSFSFEGYTATGTSNTIIITGKPNSGFNVSAATNSALSTTVTKTQDFSAPIAAVQSRGSFVIADGKVTQAVLRISGRYAPLDQLPGIRSIRVGASSPTSNDGVDLLNWTATVGLKYNTFTITDGYGSNGAALAWQIRKVINENTVGGLGHGYSARWASYGGWSGNDPWDLWIDAPASHGSLSNGELIQIEFDTDPTSVNVNDGNWGRLYDPATIATSPYNPSGGSRHIATMGTFSGGQFNRIEEVRVNGVNLITAPIDWATSNSATSSAVIAAINARTSIHGFTADLFDGAVRINGTLAMGSTVNGSQVFVSASGNVIVSQAKSMSGGVTYYVGDPEKWTVVVSGTYSAASKLTITVTDPNIADPYVFGASRVAGLKPNFSTTYKSKKYASVGSTMYFSSLNDATKWDVGDIGSGFIDLSNNFGGREDLTGFGVYQDKLAVFSRRNVQLWFLDADPAQNQQLQVLANTGCIAPDSVVSMGAIDLLYLADNGIRSLRAREGTDTAFASDIGSAIDTIVINHLKTLTEDQKYQSRAIVEPVDGRYWLSIGNKIFVLSYFPGSSITAWSTYETGFTISELSAQGNRVFARSGDTVYLYGGATADEYDNSEVVVEFPYMDTNKPATYKRAKAIDLTIEGLWMAEIGFDHTNPTAREVILRHDQSTFAFGSIPVTGIGTHFGLRMVNSAEGPAKITNVILHYDELQPKHEAG